MADDKKEKKASKGLPSHADAVGELIKIIAILFVAGAVLGKIMGFLGIASDRVAVALGRLPVGNTPVGDEIRITEDSTVFDQNGDIVGKQSTSFLGVITEGPILKNGERYWFVDFAQDPDGWVPERILKRSNGAFFDKGDTPVGTDVRSAKKIVVFDSLGGISAGFQSPSAHGVVVGGPLAYDSVRYWFVDFDTGPDGWVAEEGLTHVEGGPFEPGGTPAGKDVSLKDDATIFVEPGSTSVGVQEKNSIGSVIEGPVSKEGVRYWFVDFDTGPDGWVAEGVLALVPTFNPGLTPVGREVFIFQKGGAVVLVEPGGASRGVQVQGSSGRIIEGPVSKEGVRYWFVDFDTGPDGWVAEEGLTHVDGSLFESGITPVSTRVVIGTTTVVRAESGGVISGGQPAGARGEVIHGPVSKEGVRYWFVDFDTGPDGWVAEFYLQSLNREIFGSGDTPVGQIVQTKRTTEVVDQEGHRIGNQKAYRPGVLSAGPVFMEGERYWFIDFESGLDGWVVEPDIMPYQEPSLIRRIGSTLLSVAIVLLWVFSVILIITVGVVISRTNAVVDELSRAVAPKQKEEVLVPEKNVAWQRVVQLSESDNPSDWKLSIIEADTMLDKMIIGMGYHGETMGERMQAIEHSDFNTLDDAWEAHKVRNRIAHEGGDFLITGRETRRVIQLYKRVFEEFRLI